MSKFLAIFWYKIACDAVKLRIGFLDFCPKALAALFLDKIL